MRSVPRSAGAVIWADNAARVELPARDSMGTLAGLSRRLACEQPHAAHSSKTVAMAVKVLPAFIGPHSMNLRVRGETRANTRPRRAVRFAPSLPADKIALGPSRPTHTANARETRSCRKEWKKPSGR